MLPCALTPLCVTVGIQISLFHRWGLQGPATIRIERQREWPATDPPMSRTLGGECSSESLASISLPPPILDDSRCAPQARCSATGTTRCSARCHRRSHRRAGRPTPSSPPPPPGHGSRRRRPRASSAGAPLPQPPLPGTQALRPWAPLQQLQQQPPPPAPRPLLLPPPGSAPRSMPLQRPWGRPCGGRWTPLRW